jgi:hypothetical protein
MHRLAVLFGAVAISAGCGGSTRSSEAEVALLTGVQVSSTSVTFAFRSPPRDVRARFEAGPRLAECGSGKPVALKGRASLVVHFTPAQTAEIEGEKVTRTYPGPSRLEGPGPVLESVKTCDFEADVAWAVGLARRLPFHIVRDGSTVTVAFGE